MYIQDSCGFGGCNYAIFVTNVDTVECQDEFSYGNGDRPRCLERERIKP